MFLIKCHIFAFGIIFYNICIDIIANLFYNEDVETQSVATS